MSVNTSVFTSQRLIYHCMDSEVAVDISSILTSIRSVVLFPLCVLVLYLGLQRWRRSSQSSSHGDIFTFHLVTLELISLVGGLILLYGLHKYKPRVIEIGVHLSDQVFPAEIIFHFLTCVERYLAVAHPVTYRRMTQSVGVRIRNVSVVCVWLLCCGWSGVSIMFSPDFPVVPVMSFLVVSFAVTSFCSLRVLCILMRPRPGDVRAASRSKRRSVATIVLILLAQWLWLSALLVAIALDTSKILSQDGGCVALMAGMGFSLPSTLVLPLLFLYRAGKRLCCACSGG